MREDLDALVDTRLGYLRAGLDRRGDRSEQPPPHGVARRRDPGVGLRVGVGQRQKHARERDSIGDAVVDTHDHRHPGAEAVDQIPIPQRLAAIQRTRDQVADELLERTLVAGRRKREVVDVKIEVEVRIILPRRDPDPHTRLGDQLAKPWNGSTRRDRKISLTRSTSTGSSNHSSALTTIRFVGRSMCSQAASALLIRCALITAPLGPAGSSECTAHLPHRSPPHRP
jgi:hypothetical protein